MVALVESMQQWPWVWSQRSYDEHPVELGQRERACPRHTRAANVMVATESAVPVEQSSRIAREVAVARTAQETYQRMHRAHDYEHHRLLFAFEDCRACGEPRPETNEIEVEPDAVLRARTRSTRRQSRELNKLREATWSYARSVDTPRRA